MGNEASLACALVSVSLSFLCCTAMLCCASIPRDGQAAETAVERTSVERREGLTEAAEAVCIQPCRATVQVAKTLSVERRAEWWQQRNGSDQCAKTFTLAKIG